MIIVLVIRFYLRLRNKQFFNHRLLSPSLLRAMPSSKPRANPPRSLTPPASTAGPKIEGVVQDIIENWLQQHNYQVTARDFKILAQQYCLPQSWRKVQKWVQSKQCPSTAGPKIKGEVKDLINEWAAQQGPIITQEAIRDLISKHNLDQNWRQIRKWISNNLRPRKRTPETMAQSRKYEQNRRRAVKQLPEERQREIKNKRNALARKRRQRVRAQQACNLVPSAPKQMWDEEILGVTDGNDSWVDESFVASLWA